MAELDGTPAGYLPARIEAPFVRESPIRRIGHVGHCYVEPPARRRGMATALLGAAELWFREQGVRYAELSYLVRNEGAALAWTRLGYAPMRVFARKELPATRGSRRSRDRGI